MSLKTGMISWRELGTLALNGIDSGCLFRSNQQNNFTLPQMKAGILAAQCNGELIFFEGTALNWQLQSKLTFEDEPFTDIDSFDFTDNLLVINSRRQREAYAYTRNGSILGKPSNHCVRAF